MDLLFRIDKESVMGIHLRLVCLMFLLLLSACSLTRNDDKCVSGEDALKVANAVVEKEWPQHLRPPYPKPDLKDDGAIWEIEYGIPDGWTGGGPTFFINKETCKIEKIVAEQ